MQYDLNEYLQLIEYMLCIWKNDAQHKRPFTVVIPIVIYHGKRSFQPRPFHTYFFHLPDDLKQFIPDFEYIFTNIKKNCCCLKPYPCFWDCKGSRKLELPKF